MASILPADANVHYACNPTLFDATTGVEKVKTHLAGGTLGA